MALGSDTAAFVEEHNAPLLRAAAETIAESLATGALLGSSPALAQAVRDAFLAENADAGEAAERRCLALRKAFADEVRRTIASTPEVSYLAEGLGTHSAAAPVRVEIRGTAGRTLRSGAFLVGRAPECDVQAFGDSTVLPLQCIVVSLPQGILIADFWSGGATHVTWRSGGDSCITAPVMEMASPAAASLLAAHSGAAFVLDQGERTVIRIGERTTITLGPKTARATATTKRKAGAAVKADLEAATAGSATKAPRARPASRSRSPCTSTSFGSLFADTDSGSLPSRSASAMRQTSR